MTYILARDFLVEVAKGNVAGHALVHKFGRNDAVPNGSWAHVNLLGSAAWMIQAATQVRVKAGNGADDTAGNGAREITVVGIDDNFAEVTEAIATAGAGASSNSSASFWRVYRAYVSAAGTYSAANTAAVVIENSAGTVNLINIAIGEGQTQFCAYTVPLGKTAYMLSAHVHLHSGKTANFRMFQRRSFDDVTAPLESKRIVLHMDGITGAHRRAEASPGGGFPAKTDLWWEAWGDGAVSQVSVDFELLLVDD